MSMANSDFNLDKYIIVGIKDKPGEAREVIGLKNSDFIDDSIYQNLINDNIEPSIKFNYYSTEFEDKLIGVFKIHKSNTNRPYMLKKQYGKLAQGLCKIRRGSTNSFASRKDLDKFYLSKEKFEVQFMDDSLAAAYEEVGCARTSVTLRNYTSFPVVINYGLITILNREGEELSKHRVYGFDKDIKGADFQLTLPPMHEKLGDLYVGFNSSDCLRLGLDQYGHSDEEFRFELLFTDTNNNEYTAHVENGWVFAKGKFLWKVELEAKKNGKKQKKNPFKRILG